MGRPTVLIVDDESDIRDSIQELLQSTMKVRCIQADSGPAALEVLEERPVDLVISDYRMPGMDGLQLLAAMAKRQPDVPKILMTAYPDVSLAERAQEQGFHFLPKPVDIERFITQVDNVMAAGAAR